MPVRKTITFMDTVHAFINLFRSQLLKANIELDYTQAVNVLVVFGIKYITKGEIDESDYKILTMTKGELKLESLMSRSSELALERLPEILSKVKVVEKKT